MDITWIQSHLVARSLMPLSLQNKSAFLCGVMKTYRQREKQGTKVLDSTKGPDEAKIKELLDRTQYTLDVTTGQRKYGGPPPESVYTGAQPTVGTEVCCCRRPLLSIAKTFWSFMKENFGLKKVWGVCDFRSL